MDQIFQKRYEEVAAFRAKMCGACASEDDQIMVAALLMEQARIIFKELGGAKLAAAQFYAAADKFAVDE